jgi:uncharacterized protein
MYSIVSPYFIIIFMYYSFAVTFTTARLHALISLIEKVQSEAHARDISDSTILDARLAPDMFPFARQIQIVTDNAKGMASRLARQEAPKYEDTETTLDQLRDRLQKTIDYLATFTEDDFAEAATAEARFPYFPGLKLVGAGYLVTYGIPNFMFHVVTAYDILRNMGFQIGKSDFMGGKIEFHPDGE